MPGTPLTKCQAVAFTDLCIINVGALPKPCPTVAVVAELIPVNSTILKPALVFACTVEVIEPSVFVAVVPPLAFQQCATMLFVLPL